MNLKPRPITPQQLKDAIEDIEDFFDDLYDYFDRFADINDNGGPNEAMQWQNRINELRGRR